MNRNVSLLLLFVLLFSGCVQKSQENDDVRIQVSQWQGRKLDIPNDLVFTTYATDTVDYQYDETPYKVLIYADSTGCLECKLQLPKWKQIITELDSISSHNISYLFIFDTRKIEMVKDVLIDKDFDFPVCIDMKGRMAKLNKFSSDSRFQTFLLGDGNKIEVIGNPVRSLPVLDLYTKFLKREKVGISDEEKTKVNIPQQEIDLGTLSKGEVKTVCFTVTNVGNVPLIIKGVTTSCDCTSARMDRKRIPMQSSGKLIVQYSADTEGEFLRTVSLFGNVEGESIEFVLTGDVVHNK